MTMPLRPDVIGENDFLAPYNPDDYLPGDEEET